MESLSLSVCQVASSDSDSETVAEELLVEVLEAVLPEFVEVPAVAEVPVVVVEAKASVGSWLNSVALLSGFATSRTMTVLWYVRS